MSSTLTAVTSSASRGEVTIQPAYFTSSLFVDPFREDIEFLVNSFKAGYEHGKSSQSFQPFTLFKNIWNTYGWNLLHLKVLEDRGRESYTSVILRLFLERALSEANILDRVVGLFGLYTFWSSQPSNSIPPIRCISHIPIPIDSYESLLRLPQDITGDVELLKPYVEYIMNILLKNRIFLILPELSTCSENPRDLPREIYHTDVQDLMESGSDAKKTGRPSKQQRVRKARSALSSLDKWIERSTYPVPDCMSDPAGAPAGVQSLHGNTYGPGLSNEQGNHDNTHILLSQRPMMSLEAYRARKEDLVNTLDTSADGALNRASEKVVDRLQKIDAIAAERGLEVGGEGGELSGLGRVQKASQRLETGEKGLLGLLEGSGLQ